MKKYSPSPMVILFKAYSIELVLMNAALMGRNFRLIVYWACVNTATDLQR
jgi:hypothetical protein